MNLEEFQTRIKTAFDNTDEQTWNKLVPCGPKFLWTVNGKFLPENRPNFPGNAHQRRVLKRYYNKMEKLYQPFVDKLIS